MDLVAKLRDQEQRLPADTTISFADYLRAATVPDRNLPAFYFIHKGQGRLLDDETQLRVEIERIKGELGRELLVYEGPESPCTRDTADAEAYALHLGPKVKTLMLAIDAVGVPVSWPEASKGAWRVQVNEKAEGRLVDSLFEAIDEIHESCAKDLNIQRYKGLGEMNPSQLFESTMDPARRMLSRVAVSDMVEADRIFTVLMGPEVEPRREFIEKHALEATNIDI
jgi:DNA gyrase/topoisomerase IV subunit B